MRSSHLLLSAILLCGASASLHAQATEARPQGPQLVSPEFGANGMVTFRLRAPKASEVMLVGGPIAREVKWAGPAAQKIPMTKGEDGVWTITVVRSDPIAIRTSSRSMAFASSIRRTWT